MNIRDLLPIERNLIFIDTETTGPNSAQDRIVELGFVQLRSDGSEQEWRSLINPGIPIPPHASHGYGEYSGHGITDDLVRGCRQCGKAEGDTDAHQMLGDRPHTFLAWPTFASLAPHLLKGFTRADYGGYNVKSFDLPLLRAEFERAGHAWSYADAKILDGYRLWQLGEKRTLSDAVERFLGRKHDGAHGALDDVRASLAVVAAQLQVFQTLPRTPGQLHDLQWPRDPNAIDEDGKFIWKEGVAVVNFGKKWKGIAMQKVERGYFQWILGADGFSPEVKKIAQDALDGRLPIRGDRS